MKILKKLMELCSHLSILFWGCGPWFFMVGAHGKGVIFTSWLSRSGCDYNIPLKGTNHAMVNTLHLSVTTSQQLLRLQTKPLTPGLHRTLHTQTMVGRDGSPGPHNVGFL